MSSWVICPCGNQISSNFPSPNVYRVIPDEAFDTAIVPLDRTTLSVMFLQGRQLIECPQCGRLLLREPKGTEYRSFVPERD